MQTDSQEPSGAAIISMTSVTVCGSVAVRRGIPAARTGFSHQISPSQIGSPIVDDEFIAR